jgi:hypothetical protein
MGALSDAPRAKARNEPASSTDAVEQDARRRQQDAMAPLAKQAEQARDLAAAREASVPEQVLPPEQWLQQIEKLLKAGKDAEARASLAEFRKRYPHHPLPEALK